MEFLHGDLTKKIIGICIRVHRILGPGLLESVYEEALCYEFKLNGMQFQRQVGIPVSYGDVELELGFRADLIVENKVLLELKSLERLAPVHAKTMLTYMRFTEIEVGLLINFNVNILSEGLKRLMLDVR